MREGFIVEEPLSTSDLETKVERVAKFTGLKRHREQGGRVTIFPGKTYVLIIRREFADVEIEFMLRILLDQSSVISIQ